MKENEITNNYELHMCRGKELAAHMRCSYVNEDVVIKDLFVIKKYRGIGLEEVLLTKAMTYAARKNANQIITYCGAEPFCKEKPDPEGPGIKTRFRLRSSYCSISRSVLAPSVAGVAVAS